MATWINYTDLFPESEQAVIQEIQNLMNSQFGYSQFETFRLNFDNIPFNDFTTEAYADAFFSQLSTWLGSEAEASGDWNDFRARFNENDHGYIDLIIAAYNGNSVQDFSLEENSTRAATIKGIEGFMDAYKSMLSDYMSQLPFPITITSQPASATVCEGEEASLSVSATGEGISYQWKQNGSNVDGAVSAVLQFSEALESHQGAYQCVLSTDDGYSIETNSVTLTVNRVVSITKQPNSKEIDWNTNHTLTVEATSDTTIQYQWRKNGVAIAGATSAALSLASVSTKDSAAYDCILTDSCSQTITSKATISVVSFSSEIYTVTGSVTNKNEAPLSGIVVKAVDRKPGTSKVLGTATTDSKGTYTIEYLKSELLDQESFILNLVVQLFEEGSTEVSESSTLKEEATANEELNFSTAAFVETQTEFDLLSTYLTNTLDVSVVLSELDAEDIKLLENKSFSQEMITAYIDANNLNTQIPAVSVEHFYGLLRGGLPSQVEKLVSYSNDDLKNVLLKTASKNIISTEDEVSAQAIATLINDEETNVIETSDLNPFKNAFTKVNLTNSQKTGILEAFLNDPSGDTDVWATLTDDNTGIITELEESEIKRVITLQEVDFGNSKLVDVVDANIGSSSEATSIKELAELDIDEWEAIINDNDESLLTIPLRFTGTDEERKTAYATELRTKVEEIAPTASVFGRMKKDSTFNSQNYEDFFTEYPDFDLRRDQVAKVIADTPMNPANFTESDLTVVQKELEAAQRLFRISPKLNKYESIKPLIEDDLTTSSKIVAMGKSDFVAAYSSEIGQNEAIEIYDGATETNAKLIHLTTTYKSYNGPLVIGDKFVDSSTPIDGFPNIETLFGSLDYCSCEHCRSVYSPAAYLVDLLRYIDHRPVDENNVSLGYNLKDELENRRGEIKQLFLNCENSNTPLPYIDIVNEILENYISGSNTVYQTENTAEELKATPQNRIDSVYETTLKNAVYPSQLPFNVYDEETKSYTEKMGGNYGDFVAAMPGEGGDQLAISAALSLGLSLQQYNIITGINYHNISELYNVDEAGLLSEAEQVSLIISSIKVFLEKSGVSFSLFKELLGAKYISLTEKKIFYPIDGSCNLEYMTFGTDANPAEGYSPEELIRFNRFLRLLRLTKWSVKDLDLVINALGDDNFGIDKLNSQTILALHRVLKLKNQFNLEVEELITWWSDFDISTYVDKNLFDQLFRNQTVNHKPGDLHIPELSSILSDPPPASQLTDLDIKPLVMGAIGLTAKELDFVISQGSLTTEINTGNLTYLYRVSSFTRALGISVEDLYEQVEFYSIEPIYLSQPQTPQETLSFLDKLRLLEESPFSKEEVKYLLSGSTSSDYYLKDETITDFLNGLRESYEQLNITLPINPDNLSIEFEELVNEYFEDRSYIDAIIDGTIQIDGSDPQTELQHLGDFILPAEMDVLYDDIIYANTPDLRKAIFYSFFQRHHIIQTTLIPKITEEFAFIYELPTELTNRLLDLESLQGYSSIKKLLTELTFLTNDDEIIPSSYTHTYAVMQVAVKVSLIAKVLFVTEQELNYLINKLPSNWLQLKNLPFTDGQSIQFNEIEELISLRALDNDLFNKESTLIEFLNDQNSTNRFELLSESTGWSLTDLTYLVGANGFDLESTPEVYEEVDWIKQLQQSFSQLKIMNLDAEIALSLSLANPDSSTSYSFRNAIKSGFGEAQWLKTAPKLHDPIRQKCRDVMIAYLIAEDDLFSNETDLFNYFLIDTEMSSCQLTSRIKQATSAIQLYIQRISLGHEGNYFLNEDKMEEWGWFKNYRVWEANRKVFLYPENYLIPELRTTRSKLYEEFEETLTQEDINSKSAEKAFEKYMIGFRAVNEIEINQMCYDDDTNTLHLVGCNQQEPKQYFYRKLVNDSFWTAWEEIPLKITGTVLPIIHNGDLKLFWLNSEVSKSKPSDDSLKYNPTSNDNIGTTASTVVKEAELTLAWTVKNKHGWEEVKLSNDKVNALKHEIKALKENTTTEDRTLDEFRSEDIVMFPMIRDNHALFISINKYVKNQTSNIKELKHLWALKLELGNFVTVDLDDDDNLDSLFAKYGQLREVVDRAPTNLDFNTRSFSVYFAEYQTGYDIAYFDFEEDEKRQFNLAEEGSFAYGSNTNQKYQNQKLVLNDLTSLNVIHEITTNDLAEIHNRSFFSPLNDFAIIQSARFGFKHTPLLAYFSQRPLTLIKDIGGEFPLLSDDSLMKNKNQAPFFIKDGERVFIVYSEQYNDPFNTPNILTYWRNLNPTTIRRNSFHTFENPGRKLFTRTLSGQELE